MADLIGHDCSLGGIAAGPIGYTGFAGWKRTTPGVGWVYLRHHYTDANPSADLQQVVASGNITGIQSAEPRATVVRTIYGTHVVVASTPDDPYPNAEHGRRLVTYEDTGGGATFSLIDTLESGADVYSVEGAGLAGWDGAYTPSGTFGGYTRYRLDDTHWICWATYGALTAWVLSVVQDPDELADIRYYSLADPGDVPSENLWYDADVSYAPAPVVLRDGLKAPHIGGSDYLGGLWMAVGLDSGAVRVYWREYGATSWTRTDLDPFSGETTLLEPTVALLPDGSVIVGASQAAPGYRFTRSRDAGHSWSEVTGANLIGEGLTLGSVVGTPLGGVYLVGWDGTNEEVRVHCADATGDLARITVPAAYITVCAAEDECRTRIIRHIDGSLLVAVEHTVVGGDYPEWDTDWYRCRNEAAGFVQVTAP